VTGYRIDMNRNRGGGTEQQPSKFGARHDAEGRSVDAGASSEVCSGVLPQNLREARKGKNLKPKLSPEL
jgi:hypothetical protein